MGTHISFPNCKPFSWKQTVRHLNLDYHQPYIIYRMGQYIGLKLFLESRDAKKLIGNMISYVPTTRNQFLIYNYT